MKNLFLVCLLFLTGCSATMLLGGAGVLAQAYVMWKNGEAHKYYKADSDTLYRVTKRVTTKLNLKVNKDEQDGQSYYLNVGEKDRFKIKIQPKENNLSEVSIRINFMGDKDFAELIYKNIDDNLNIINFRKGIPVKL